MRASTLRKIRNLVVVREHYRKAGALRRSRKSFGLYTGLDSIVAFCDGNPRLLTALLGQLLAPQAMRGNVVTRPRQSHAIESIMARFFSLIYSAEAVETSNGMVLSLAELVIKVGDAFADRVIDHPFSDNVPLSFTVDRKISEEYIKLLRTGINMGVFVHIPNRSDERLPLDLFGEQFRLSYVLAPYFGLPIRLGRPIALSTLLLQEIRYRREFRSNLIRTPNVQAHQYSLFLEPQIRKSE